MSASENKPHLNVELKDAAKEQEKEKIINKLAVIAAYDADPDAIGLLTKLGITDMDAIMARAEQHPEFDIKVKLAKQHEREALRFGIPSKKVEEALQEFGIKDGRQIYTLSLVVPNSKVDYKALEKKFEKEIKEQSKKKE